MVVFFTKKGGRSRFTVRPPFSSLSSVVLLFFRFPPLFPFGKLPLALLTLVKGEDIRHDAAGDGLNVELWNVGVVYQFFASAQVLPPFLLIQFSTPHERPSQLGMKIRQVYGGVESGTLRAAGEVRLHLGGIFTPFVQRRRIAQENSSM